MYRLEELIDSYSEDLLGEGGILALSESGKFTCKKNKRNNRNFIDLADFFIQEDSRFYDEYDAKVTIDPELGLVNDCSCDCHEFLVSKYACKHVVAAQIQWAYKEYGKEALEKSKLKEIIAKKSGYPNPFLPGILRRTNKGLMELANRQNSKGKNKLNNLLAVKATPGEKLKLEVHMGSERYKGISLKVGYKKMLIVKKIDEFLEAFSKEGILSYGKNLSFVARESDFETCYQPLIRFLRRVYNDIADSQTVGIDMPRFVEDLKQICLMPTEFDAAMDFFKEIPLWIDGKPCLYNDEEYKPEGHIEKLEYGAIFKVETQEIIATTHEYMYVRIGDTIRRMVNDESGFMNNLLEAMDSEDEIYISEKDMPFICSSILPELNDRMLLTAKGVDIVSYLPEKPTIKLYMDYPQEDMISCKPVACYTKKEYPLVLDVKANQKRDIDTEKNAFASLQQFFHAYDSAGQMMVYQGDVGDIYFFLTEIMPQLEGFGEVFISDKLKNLTVKRAGHFDVGVSVAKGSLTLSLASDELTPNEIIEILSSYDRKAKFFRLKSGAFVKIDEEQKIAWQAVAECIKGLRKPKQSEWRIPLFRAIYLDEMLRNRDEVTMNTTREYRKLVSRIKEAQNSDTEIPKSLEGIMREYQADGFRWMSTLKSCGFSGILADDMGLGKTLQVLCLLLSQKEKGCKGDSMRTLIVTPASLVYNWKHEIEKYTPTLTVNVVTGSVTERQSMLLGCQEKAEENDADIWITSYDLLKRDITWYEGIHFANEIIDEAQYIKNQNTNAAKAVRLIDSEFRMALTGTPIENRLSEMWSIFDYLMPGFLYNYTRFRMEIELPIVNDEDAETLDRMRKMVHPFILRRLKGEVLKDLPDKIEEEVTIKLEGEQRRIYQAHAQRLKMYLEKQSVEEFSKGKIEMLAELTKLRQICCAPELIMDKYSAENGKLDACMELIHQAIDGGHKMLLFSQFTSMLDLIGQRLKSEKIEYYRIDGSVKKEERTRLVDDFNANDVPVFCISLKAGGTGLNLTSADIVIHYDPWWNMAAQNQATDRTHRIGQKNVVTVYQLIASDTIEDKIRLLQKSKSKLADDILSGESIASVIIDKDQIMSLLD